MSSSAPDLPGNPQLSRDPATLSAGLGFASQPEGLRSLYFTELWERFSYYGMRALLVLFMVAPLADGGLAFSNTEAARVYGNYTMAVYMLAIPGGFIADRLIGARRAVAFGGWVIALGHYALAIPMRATFYLGLVLIVLGTGLFKPNISALVGALYHKSDPRRDAGFSLFYMGINIGAFVSPLVTGFLAQSATFKAWLAQAGFDPAQSWHWGFAAAGVGMTLAMILFQRAAPTLRDPGADEPQGEDRDLFWRHAGWVLLGTVGLLALALASDIEGLSWLRWTFLILPLAAISYFVAKGGEDNNRIAAIGVLFIAAMIFFAIFEQMGSSMSLFADQLTDNRIFGFEYPSSWFQSVNPIFVILLAPMFAYLWLRLGRRQPSAPVKFATGLALVAASLFLMVPAAQLAGAGRVSPMWLAGLFFLQTCGELCLSPVGLSTMTRLAPAKLTGVVLGVWFLAAAFGNKLAGVLGGTFESNDTGALSSFLWTQGLWVALAAALLFALTPWVKRLSGETG